VTFDLAFMMKRNQDVEHLGLLATFHYVLSGLMAVVSLFPLVHVAIGIAILNGAFDQAGNGDPPPRLFGWILVAIPILMILVGLATSVCIAVVGRRLGQHQSYMFCFVMAAIECVLVPFGTALGIFTIIVLSRPTAKMLFEAAQSDNRV
jgi:hypothetical protein